LVFAGKNLQDEDSKKGISDFKIKDYGLQANSTIFLVLRMHGGSEIKLKIVLVNKE
jgi:hypothetical protein